MRGIVLSWRSEVAPRYVGILAPSSEQERPDESALAKAGLQPVFSHAGLSIFASADTPLVALANDYGVVVGTLFDRSRFARVTRLDEKNTQSVVSTEGQTLVRDYWGGYVAFIRGTMPAAITVLRDPSGALPVYYAETGGRLVFASDVDGLIAAGLPKPDIDWGFFRQHFLAFDLRTPRTALTGVKELLSGFSMSSREAKPRVTQRWTPWDYAEPLPQRSRAEMIKEVQEVVIGATAALAKVHNKVLLGISGGLDSSILASCLATSGTSFAGFNMMTSDPSGDERRYARAARDALEFELTEAAHRIDDIDVLRSSAAHLPRPLQYAFGQSESRFKFALAKSIGADALFAGIGGDNVFCLMQSASPALDRLLREGLTRGTLETVKDVCRLTGCSTFDVATMAARRLIRCRRPYAWQVDTRYLSSDLISGGATLQDHPWLQAPGRFLPGKATHISMLARIQGTIDGYPRKEHPVQILPFLSQPVMEACLRVPTWEWVAGGQDRSVVRQGFAGRLPETILRRRSKGGPTSFAYDVIERNRHLLRHHLCTGLLADHGLLDKTAIKVALSPLTVMRGNDHLRLALIAEAEAWVRYWST